LSILSLEIRQAQDDSVFVMLSETRENKYLFCLSFFLLEIRQAQDDNVEILRFRYGTTCKLRYKLCLLSFVLRMTRRLVMLSKKRSVVETSLVYDRRFFFGTQGDNPFLWLPEAPYSSVIDCKLFLWCHRPSFPVQG
jgi:CRISPR/Cas system CMR subunit Cmr6 (Cas7 group RAMP superfamily)